MAGTGIGTFSDRLRDAVRGGGPFDADPRIQGFASGLFTDPNDSPANGTPAEQRARLLHYQDLIKLGLAGNLRDYTFIDAPGRRSRARRSTTTASPRATPPIRARRSPTSTRTTTRRCSTRSQYKLPQGTRDGRPGAHEHARARHHGARPGPVVLARRQRPAALQVAGPQQLRLRRLVQPHRLVRCRSRRSAPGCRRARDNAGQVGLHAAAARRPGAQAAARPTSTRRTRAPTTCCGSASPRRCSGSAARGCIQDRVSFPGGGPGQTPGVIVMAIDDSRGRDIDRRLEGVVVVFNASPEATTPDRGRRSRAGATRCTRCRRAAATRSSASPATSRRPARSPSPPAPSRCSSRRSARPSAGRARGAGPCGRAPRRARLALACTRGAGRPGRRAGRRRCGRPRRRRAATGAGGRGTRCRR